MDIWSWVWSKQSELVRLGQPRLATIMERVPTATCDGRSQEVEAIVAEGIALARDAKQPWVELFLRHWRLQSRIFHNCEVRDGMREGVELLDFAHQEATEGCPQSICATQDFARGYALLDGRTYADARLTACDETLARIDRRWACWSCVGVERADALLDARRFEEALAFARAEAVALETQGLAAAAFRRAEAEALLALGRPEEALRVVAKARMAGGGRSHDTSHRLLEALVAARLGNRERARAKLGDPGTLSGLHYVGHARVIRELARLGEHEPVRERLLGAARGVQTLAQRGARFVAMLVARIVSEAAAEIGELELASDLLDEAAHLAEGLEVASHDRTRIAEIRTRLGETAESDLEHALDRRIACGLTRRATQTVEALSQGAAADEALFRRVVTRLRHANEGPVLERFLEGLGPAHEREVRCLRAELALARGGHDEARRWIAPLLADGGTQLRERMVYASLLRDEGSFAEAVAWLRPTLERDGTEAARELAIVATCAGDHRAARDAARGLGFDVQPDLDEPIELELERILVESTAADGTKTVVEAQRTSPVVARVLSLGTPGAPSPYEDRIVFDPVPISDAGPDDARTTPRFTYRQLHALESHSRVLHLIEGVRALDSVDLAGLVETLRSHGFEVVEVSDHVDRVGDDRSPAHHAVSLRLLVRSDEPLSGFAERVLSAIDVEGYYLIPTTILDALGDYDTLDEAYRRQDDFLFPLEESADPNAD